MLITIADIQKVRDVSNAINAVKRVDTFIDEAEQIDVKPVLNACGKDFFYSIVMLDGQSPPDDKIELLLAGGTYVNKSNETISFCGLRKVIALYAYARLVANNPVNVTAHGVTQKTTTYSTPHTGTSLQKPVMEARTAAMQYFEEVKRFLCDKSSDYPLYVSGGGRKQSGGFRVRSIP